MEQFTLKYYPAIIGILALCFTVYGYAVSTTIVYYSPTTGKPIACLFENAKYEADAFVCQEAIKGIHRRKYVNPDFAMDQGE